MTEPQVQPSMDASFNAFLGDEAHSARVAAAFDRADKSETFIHRVMGLIDAGKEMVTHRCREGATREETNAAALTMGVILGISAVVRQHEKDMATMGVMTPEALLWALLLAQMKDLMNISAQGLKAGVEKAREKEAGNG